MTLPESHDGPNVSGEGRTGGRVGVDGAERGRSLLSLTTVGSVRSSPTGTRVGWGWEWDLDPCRVGVVLDVGPTRARTDSGQGRGVQVVRRTPSVREFNHVAYEILSNPSCLSNFSFLFRFLLVNRY